VLCAPVAFVDDQRVRDRGYVIGDRRACRIELGQDVETGAGLT
jgi:hypothetical protein